MGKKKVNIEVLYAMDDKINEKISFGIFAIVKDGDISHTHQIKSVTFTGEDYINSIKSIESDITSYYKTLCILTDEEKSNISFLKK